MIAALVWSWWLSQTIRLRLRGDAVSMVESIVELAQGQETEAEFAHYLRCNCDPPRHLEKRS